MKARFPIFLAVAVFFSARCGAAAQLVPKVDVPVRTWMQDLSGGKQVRLDDAFQYIPLGAEVLLGFGVPAVHPFRERVALSLTSYAVMMTLTQGSKYLLDVQRPYGGRRSFPSGHTAAAFLGAELIRMDYGNAYGAAAYAIAVATGFLRMYNDRHWMSDVLGGAAIGVLSAHIGHWLLPFERSVFGWNGSAAVVALPYAAPGQYGFSLAMTF